MKIAAPYANCVVQAGVGRKWRLGPVPAEANQYCEKEK